MIHGVPLPAELVTKMTEYSSGESEPATPRNAATVVLLREADATLEAYLLRRQVSMEFAGGFCVFPGGGVDKRDFELPDDHWAGPSPQEWAARMDCSVDEARALVCAAIRETFEESGVLFAGTPTAVVSDVSGDGWEADRVALEARDLSLTEFLMRRGLVLRTDLLSVLGGWLTPVFEPKRYRTWFFVAALPEGQRTRDVSSESDQVLWGSLPTIVDSVDGGDIVMLPPTYYTILEFLGLESADAAREHAAGVPFAMVEPVATQTDDGMVLAVPDRFADLYVAAHP